LDHGDSAFMRSFERACTTPSSTVNSHILTCFNPS
jgi:hypothetical protein